jgi:hypothetical protein
MPEKSSKFAQEPCDWLDFDVFDDKTTNLGVPAFVYTTMKLVPAPRHHEGVLASSFLALKSLL